jgi:hypothetical protein
MTSPYTTFDNSSQGPLADHKAVVGPTYRKGAPRDHQDQGGLPRKTAMTMVFKICQSASRKWRRLDDSHQLAEIIKDVNSRTEKRSLNAPPDPAVTNI